jgi:hypothetical protein
MTTFLSHITAICSNNGKGGAAARCWAITQPEHKDNDLWVEAMKVVLAAEAAEATKAKKIKAAEAAREKTRANHERVKAEAERRQRLAAEAATADSSTNIVPIRPVSTLTPAEQAARQQALEAANADEAKAAADRQAIADAEAEAARVAKIASMNCFKAKKGPGGKRHRANAHAA